MRHSPRCRFRSGQSPSPACAIESRFSIASRLRPALCWCSTPPPSPALYKFLFTRGPLWKIWNSSKPNLRARSPNPNSSSAKAARHRRSPAQRPGRHRLDDRHRQELYPPIRNPEGSIEPPWSTRRNCAIGSSPSLGNRGHRRRLRASQPHCQGRAARLEHVVPPAPYFPPGAIWTQDISHAPVDPQSDAIINWLADAGGWGNSNKMQVDFAHARAAGRRHHADGPLSQRPRFYGRRFRQRRVLSASRRRRH